MTDKLRDYCASLLGAKTAADVAEIENSLNIECGPNRISWEALGGNTNNRGPIDVASNPGRALVERVTNGKDALLELEFALHHGKPLCQSPREAAAAWFGTPLEGLGALSQAERAALADKLVLTRLDAGTKNKRTVSIRDRGIGVLGSDFPHTLLSINKGNKIDKRYLAGVYGQGGSATLVYCDYTVFISRKHGSGDVSFTIVRFMDRPAELFKDGFYAYLTLDGEIPTFAAEDSFFEHGTLVTHFGYDLSGFDGNVGPRSLYGLLNQILFDGVMPYWMSLPGTSVGRRSIIGARPRLVGLSKGSDDDTPDPDKVGVAYTIPKAYLGLDELGSIAFEAWLLTQPPKMKEPSKGFVDPTNPIIFTINGQNQAELSRTIIRRHAELPYLASRLIVHVDCDKLSAIAKRKLFTSTREQARQSDVLLKITQQIIDFLKSDPRLAAENEHARNTSQESQDDDQSRQIREDISKLLKLQGVETVLSQKGGTGKGGEPGSNKPKGPRLPRSPLPLSDPPTIVRLAWDEDSPQAIYPGQTRFLPVETDAYASWHDPSDPAKSNFNFVGEPGLTIKGTTQLDGGRMRVIVHLAEDVEVHKLLSLTVELRRPGLSVLSDTKLLKAIPKPERKPKGTELLVPRFEFRPVDGPDDEQWAVLGWPDDIREVCSESDLRDGTLTVNYSRLFPAFRSLFDREAAKAAASGDLFERKFRKWIGAHGLLVADADRQAASSDLVINTSEDDEAQQTLRRAEGTRVGRLAAMMAISEMRAEKAGPDDD